jgi:hypothetical protein
MKRLGKTTLVGGALAFLLIAMFVISPATTYSPFAALAQQPPPPPPPPTLPPGELDRLV